MNEGSPGVGGLVVGFEFGEGGKDVGGDGFAGLGRVHVDLFLEALRFVGASPFKAGQRSRKQSRHTPELAGSAVGPI